MAGFGWDPPDDDNNGGSNNSDKNGESSKNGKSGKDDSPSKTDKFSKRWSPSRMINRSHSMPNPPTKGLTASAISTPDSSIASVFTPQKNPWSTVSTPNTSAVPSAKNSPRRQLKISNSRKLTAIEEESSTQTRKSTASPKEPTELPVPDLRPVYDGQSSPSAPQRPGEVITRSSPTATSWKTDKEIVTYPHIPTITPDAQICVSPTSITSSVPSNQSAKYEKPLPSLPPSTTSPRVQYPKLSPSGSSSVRYPELPSSGSPSDPPHPSDTKKTVNSPTIKTVDSPVTQLVDKFHRLRLDSSVPRINASFDLTLSIEPGPPGVPPGGGGGGDSPDGSDDGGDNPGGSDDGGGGPDGSDARRRQQLIFALESMGVEPTDWYCVTTEDLGILVQQINGHTKSFPPGGPSGGGGGGGGGPPPPNWPPNGPPPNGPPKFPLPPYHPPPDSSQDVPMEDAPQTLQFADAIVEHRAPREQIIPEMIRVSEGEYDRKFLEKADDESLELLREDTLARAGLDNFEGEVIEVPVYGRDEAPNDLMSGALIPENVDPASVPQTSLASKVRSKLSLITPDFDDSTVCFSSWKRMTAAMPNYILNNEAVASMAAIKWKNPKDIKKKLTNFYTTVSGLRRAEKVVKARENSGVIPPGPNELRDEYLMAELQKRGGFVDGSPLVIYPPDFKLGEGVDADPVYWQNVAGYFDSDWREWDRKKIDELQAEQMKRDQQKREEKEKQQLMELQEKQRLKEQQGEQQQLKPQQKLKKQQELTEQQELKEQQVLKEQQDMKQQQEFKEQQQKEKGKEKKEVKNGKWEESNKQDKNEKEGKGKNQEKKDKGGKDKPEKNEQEKNEKKGKKGKGKNQDKEDGEKEKKQDTKDKKGKKKDDKKGKKKDDKKDDKKDGKDDDKNDGKKR